MGLRARLEWLGRLIQRDVLLDLFIVAGFASAVIGGWQLSRPWTLIIGGAFLVLLGLLAMLGGRKAPPYIEDSGRKPMGRLQ
jgi:hypothetical protein